MGPEEVSEADPEAGAIPVLSRSGHVDQEGALVVGFRPYLADADRLGQQAQGRPTERVVLFLRFRLCEGEGPFVPQGEDAVAFVDDDRARRHERAAPAVGAGPGLCVVAGGVVDRYQRHLLARVLVDVVGQLPDDLVLPDAHGAPSPWRCV